MFVGALCGVSVALLLGQPSYSKLFLGLSLLLIFGTVVGGILGLLMGIGRTLFLTGSPTPKSD